MNLVFFRLFFIIYRIIELSLYLSTSKEIKSKINVESEHSTIALYIIMVYHIFIVVK
jgi:hypothetical protein